jgi:hypothetical protein
LLQGLLLHFILVLLLLLLSFVVDAFFLLDPDHLLLLLPRLTQLSQQDLDLALKLLQQEEGLEVLLLAVHQAVLLAELDDLSFEELEEVRGLVLVGRLCELFQFLVSLLDQFEDLRLVVEQLVFLLV